MSSFEENKQIFEKLLTEIAEADVNKHLYFEGKISLTKVQSVALIGQLYRLINSQQQEISRLTEIAEAK